MKIKVLMVEPSGYGGMAHYTSCLCDRLATFSGLDLKLLTDSSYELGEHPAGYEVIKVDLVHVPYLQAVKNIWRIFRRTAPHIIHIQALLTARRDVFLFLLAKIAGLKIVYTAHNVLPHDEEERNAVGMRFVFGKIYQWSSAVITHTHFNRRELIDTYRLHRQRIAVIAHGNYLFQSERTQRYTRENARRILGIPAAGNVILFFGAVRAYKGVLEILEALELLLNTNARAVLLIAGRADQHLQKRIESFTQLKQLSEKILFVNHYVPLENLGLYFDASDVVVLPYHHSYGSGALHTAMAFSKPIIAADIPLFREILGDAGAGIFCKPKDARSLADSIAAFFALSSKKQAEIANRSHLVAEAQYGWQAIAQKTYRLYTALLE